MRKANKLDIDAISALALLFPGSEREPYRELEMLGSNVARSACVKCSRS